MIISADSPEEVAVWFCRLLEAPSFRAGFPHLLGRRARMEGTAARLLAGPSETLAAVMHGIRPGRLTVELRTRRKLPCEVTVETAARMQATMTAVELADLIEQALKDQRPNETDWIDVFDDLWRVEVKGYKPPSAAGKRTPDAKDDPVIRNAQKARRVLGQARKPGRRNATAGSVRAG
jgi:hypothetical protein